MLSIGCWRRQKRKCLHHGRCIIQLTLLGYILVPIFTYNQWWLVLLYACFMLYVGCLEAAQRPAYCYTVGAAGLLGSSLLGCTGKCQGGITDALT